MLTGWDFCSQSSFVWHAAIWVNLSQAETQLAPPHHHFPQIKAESTEYVTTEYSWGSQALSNRGLPWQHAEGQPYFVLNGIDCSCLCLSYRVAACGCFFPHHALLHLDKIFDTICHILAYLTPDQHKDGSLNLSVVSHLSLLLVSINLNITS